MLPALAEELAHIAALSDTLLLGEDHFLVFTHWQTILQTLALAFQRVLEKKLDLSHNAFVGSVLSR